jgi:hypothetical protein
VANLLMVWLGCLVAGLAISIVLWLLTVIS